MYNVYIISDFIDGAYRYKIGRTKRNPKIRLKELKTGNSRPLEIVKVFESKWGTKIEAALHRRYSYLRGDGEWFDLSEEDIKSFEEQCAQIHRNFECLAENSDWFREQKEFKKFL